MLQIIFQHKWTESVFRTLQHFNNVFYVHLIGGYIICQESNSKDAAPNSLLLVIRLLN